MGDKQKKKVLVTASTFPRWEGDTEPRFVLDLASHMTDEFDVTVLVPAALGAKDKEVLEGVKVIRYHYFPIHKWETLCYPGAIVPRIKEKKIRILLVPFLFISLYFKLWKILPEYDIVHAHWLIPQGIIQSFFKKPYIVTGHGGDIAAFNKGIIKNLKKKCLRKATYAVVVSKQKLGEIKKIYFRDYEIISMGVDFQKFEKTNNYISNFFNQNGKTVVLFVGRLVEIKGIEYLIKGIKGLNIKLIIIGNGPLKNKLEQVAKEQNSDIEFWGNRNHDELCKIYASANILVVPSIIDSNGAQEGLPTVILEGMASGLPIIATNTGGISDIVKDGINGFLVPEKSSDAIKEKIEMLMTDEILASSLSKQAVADVSKYDYNVKAEQYKVLYRKLINEDR